MHSVVVDYLRSLLAVSQLLLLGPCTWLGYVSENATLGPFTVNNTTTEIAYEFQAQAARRTCHLSAWLLSADGKDGGLILDSRPEPSASGMITVNMRPGVAYTIYAHSRIWTAADGTHNGCSYYRFMIDGTPLAPAP